MKNNLNASRNKFMDNSLNGIYEFMALAYEGNWQYRWDQTPYMQKNIKASKNESILAHQWACIGFWFFLSRICPNLSTLVNTAEIYERLLVHDLGETFEGDIPQFLQLQGYGFGKHVIERKEMEKIGKTIPKNILKQLLTWFDEFEDDFENMEKLEVLIAKFIDLLQGNHFALAFGNNLKQNSETINKTLNKRFIKIANQLLHVLKERGYKKAHKEVLDVLAHHLKFHKKAGIKISLNFLSTKKFD